MLPRTPHVWIAQVDRPSGDLLRDVVEEMGIAAEQLEPQELLRRLARGATPYGMLVDDGEGSVVTAAILAFAPRIERIVVLTRRVPFDLALPRNARLLRDCCDAERLEGALHWLWGSADGGAWWADQVGTAPASAAPAAPAAPA